MLQCPLHPGADLTYLGDLGRTSAYRCRQCGVVFTDEDDLTVEESRSGTMSDEGPQGDGGLRCADVRVLAGSVPGTPERQRVARGATLSQTTLMVRECHRQERRNRAGEY
jgi:hypothetical protein